MSTRGRGLEDYLVLLPWLLLISCPPLDAIGHADEEEASIEQMMALLQNIDPYRPQRAVTTKIEVFGSASMDGLAHGWTTGFKQFHPDAEIVISDSGAESTLKRLVEDPTGIAMLSRPISEQELDELRKAGLKRPAGITVAREALGVFVHPENPITSISGTQLRSVFTDSGVPSDQLNWQMLGAPQDWSSKPIRVISRTEQSGTQVYLKDFVFQSAEMRSGVASYASNAEVVQAIEKDPLSIGICGLKCGAKEARALQLVAGSQVIPSDDFSVMSGNYPLTRPLTVVIDLGRTGQDAEADREFIRYTLGQSGQTQAILSGYYPLEIPLLRAEIEQINGPTDDD